ncbi:MAG: glycosyltransferase family 9 protein, partial [Stellaceae bacterium]
ARLTVGNDTGVCHLAAAAGCPLVVLFSKASDPARVAPRGPVVSILGAPDLNDLAAETVIAEAMDLLAADPPSPQPSPRVRGEGAGSGLSAGSLTPHAERGTG